MPHADVLSFVPRGLLARLGPIAAERTEVAWQGTVLSADLSGFSELTDRLTELGRDGIGRLSALLDGSLGAVIDAVIDSGADVVKLTGDGLLAAWHGLSPADEEIAAALRCAWTAQREIQQLAAREDENLTARIGISYGPIVATRLGGVGGRWEAIVAGQAVDAALSAQASCPKGAVELHGSCDTHAPFLRAEPAKTKRRMVARDAFHRMPTGPLEGVPLPTWRGDPEAFVALAHAHVPSPLTTLLAQDAGRWIAEVRRISVLFVQICNTADLGQVPLPLIHEALRRVQEALQEAGGTLDKVSIDEKGILAVCVFGLPPDTREQQATRALGAASRMHTTLQPIVGAPSIGVATGKVLCGPVGSRERREYTLLGCTVNLAARLMQKAGHQVRCDRFTRDGAQDRVCFDAGTVEPIKGFRVQVPTYTLAHIDEKCSPAPDTVGRGSELLILESSLLALREGRGGCAVLVGPAGIGKSAVLRLFLARVKEAGLPSVEGSGDPIRRNAPFHAWRTIVAGILDLPWHQPPSAEVLAAALPSHLVAAAPLLAPFLGLDLPDSRYTASMPPAVRVETTEALVLELVHRATPRVFVLDDVHWADSASWSLLLRLARDPTHHLLVVASRPSVDGGQLEKLTASPSARVLNLAPLDATEQLVLAAQALGARNVPPDLASWLSHASGGNPFFLLQLVNGLREAGKVDVQGNRVTWSGPGAHPIPPSLDDVIHGRIDTLPAAARLLLTAAACLGARFSEEGVAHVCASDMGAEVFSRTFATLSEAGLLVRSATTVGEWSFGHALLRDAVIGRHLPAQAEEMHGRAAAWLEGHGGTAEEIAHHWLGAHLPRRAIVYLEVASAGALRAGAFPEAVEGYRRLLSIAEEAPESFKAATLATYERSLADALFAMGDVRSSFQHADHALDHLRFERIPRSVRGRVGRLAREALAHAFLLVFAGSAGVGERSRYDEAAAAALRMTEAAYFRDGLTVAACGLFALNVALRAGTSFTLVRNLSTAGAWVGSWISMLAARVYFRRAHHVAADLSDPTTSAWVTWGEAMAQGGLGRWEDCGRNARTALGVAVDRRDIQLAQYCRTVLSMRGYLTGRFPEGSRYFQELRRQAEDCRNTQFRAWGHYGLTECLLPMGELDEAQAELERAEALLADGQDVPSLVLVGGLRVRLLLHRGDPAAAAEVAARQVEAALSLYPYVWAIMEAYASPAEGLLAVPGVDPALVDRAMEAMQRYARHFPIGRPRWRYLQGLRAVQHGQPDRALHAWGAGVTQARRLGMRYEEARLLRAMAGLNGDPAGLAVLADGILGELGAVLPPTA